MNYEEAIELNVLNEKIGKGKGVKIAILDTGLDEKWAIPTKFRMNMQRKKDPTADDRGHGTMVAGIVYNIAPEAELYIFKVLDERGHGSVSNIMDGITGAINIGCDIVCLSLGGVGTMPEGFFAKLDEARRAGIVLIAPSGNSGVHGIEYPARREDVWAVGGIDEDFKRAEFSNYGAELDFVAPSTNIQSSFLDGKYAIDSGTSFSCPMIVGMLACVMSYFDKKKMDYKQIMINGSKKLGNSIDFGAGQPTGSLLYEEIKKMESVE